MITKKCTKCNLLKDISLFGKDATRIDGLRPHCNDCRKKESKLYREKYPDKRKKTLEIYYENNKEKELLRQKKYRSKNSEKRKQTVKNWQFKNKDRIKLKANILKKNKRENNPLYKLLYYLRNRTRKYIHKNNKYNTNTREIIGCSPDELKQYIEKQFKEGMTWENYGFYGWHIDHIIPLSSAKNKEEIYKLCHYTNLQPLWMLENLKKGSKLI